MNAIARLADDPAKLPPELLEALLEDYRRALRGSFLAWCEHCLAPLGHKPAAHHRLIISELQAVAECRTDKLMLFLPPGSAKSTYASVLFPPWFMGRQRGQDVIGASHTMGLAERFGRQARDTVAEHGSMLGAELAGDNAAAGNWRLDTGSRYYAVGAGGSLTGRRADCLPGNTIVQTISGPCRLDQVVVGTETGYVLSYDAAAKASRYCRVSAVMRRDAKELWRIRTASGRVVEATGRHLVFTAKGWTSAARVAVGDVLLCVVREAGAQDGLRSREESPQGRKAVLQLGLLSTDNQCGSGQSAAADLQFLRSEAAEQASRSAVVLLCLPSGNLDQGASPARGSDPEAATKAVPDVPGCIHAIQSACDGAVLFAGVQERGACGEYGRWNQPKLARWHDAGPIPGWPGARVQGRQESGDATGWAVLRGLWHRWKVRGAQARRPSHRHGQSQQRAEQYRDPLSALSLEAARGGSRDTAPDVVAVVERVCREEVVYDIEVEQTHCFFANGVLVHNCAIIDDPVADAEEADSETQREKLWEWYQSVLATRLKPGGRTVLVMTRWHQDDLGGRLLETEPDAWRVLKMPALAEDNDPLGREPGTPLWADGDYGYGSELERKRDGYMQAGASRVWSALYQQNPVPGEGALFRADMIGTVDAMPYGTQMVRGWDLAATAQTGSRDPDWTVGLLLAQDGFRWIVADVVRLRGGPEEVERVIKATAQRDGKNVRVSIPQDPGQAGLQQIAYLTGQLAGWTVTSSRETGDKATRAAPVAAQCNVGNLAMLRGSWNRQFVDELRDFPSGTKDDQVDALSRAFSELNGGTYNATGSWI